MERQVDDGESGEERDPLIGIKAKTSWFQATRSWSGGRRRVLGSKGLVANYYHAMSRTCGGEVFFDEVEKEALRRVIWRVAEFCGVEVLTYCVMGNHFHVLVSVPHHGAYVERFAGPEGEKRLLGHLRSLYSKGYVEQLEAQMREWRRQGQETAVQVRLKSYTDRMADLSRYVKEVKERFSRWYNKRHERKGTLWMDRFKSVLIEGRSGRNEREVDRIDVVKEVAAYIDLNPVRAGLVRDSKDYPWCGYGEAMGEGTRKAKRALSRVMERPESDWEKGEAGRSYGKMLAGVEQARGKVKANAASESGEEGEEVMVKTYSEGLVLGSKAFVEEVYEANRGYFGGKRKVGAVPAPGCAEGLYVVKRRGCLQRADE